MKEMEMLYTVSYIKVSIASTGRQLLQSAGERL